MHGQHSVAIFRGKDEGPKKSQAKRRTFAKRTSSPRISSVLSAVLSILGLRNIKGACKYCYFLLRLHV
jgi:hypothetical protein